MALVDDLDTMAKLMRRHESSFYDTIYGGAGLLNRLPTPQPRNDGNPFFAGVQVHENHMFPYEQTCSECGGTGEGVTSTYCPKCKGAGRSRIDGVMVGAGDKMVVIVHNYPPKPVRWPSSVGVPKRSNPGIRAVAYP